MCKAEVRKLSLLANDTALLNTAIRSLLVQMEMSKRDSADQQQEISLLTERVDQKTQSIVLLKSINEDLQKLAERSKKHWSFGPVVGYGLAGTSANVFLGVGISYSIIKW